MHDLIVIGGGPAGLSAALNGAAEGLDVLLLERSDVLGGQAGTSSRIENYLGFPDGIAGAPLTQAAAQQAQRLGADIRTSHEVVNLAHNPATGFWQTSCKWGSEHLSRAVLVTVGVDYRRLTVPGADIAEQAGLILYGAPASAHEECEGQEVTVIGGGNSAGQAALSLAGVGATVTLLARRPLKATMSNYLIERVALHPNINARLGEVRGVALNNLSDGEHHWHAARTFAYIGTTPRAEFVHECCKIREPGFIETDGQHMAHTAGLFAAGDVRQGSFKRVAAAVGEGAVAAAAAWRYIYNA